MVAPKKSKINIGWREWVALPDLQVPTIKVKVDTGAKTSALHTFFLKTFKKNGVWRVRFGLHPVQKRKDIEIFGEAALLDQRFVRDSGGHREERCVIQTPIRMGAEEWPIEVTLASRETMVFRMLLGRSAMRGRITVHPNTSFKLGRIKKSELEKMYFSTSR
jgi:hypothetical protein